MKLRVVSVAAVAMAALFRARRGAAPRRCTTADERTYASAQLLADEIAQLTRTHQMPPWKPVAGCGAFADERCLTQHDIDLISAWAAAGAPEGDRAQLPPRQKFGGAWKLGKPDLVVSMPEPYAPPGDRETFRSIVIPLDFPETRYVTSIDVRPSSPRSVHHVTAMIDSSGKARKLDAADPKPGYDALYFAKKQSRRQLEYKAIALGALEIPAGNPDVRVTSSFTLPKQFTCTPSAVACTTSGTASTSMRRGPAARASVC